MVKSELFNFTLQGNDVRLDFDVCFSNPPAAVLQETPVLGKPKHRVRNEMENGKKPET